MRVAIARYIKLQDNYFFDLFDATTAGTLKQAGHEVIVAERLAAPGFTEEGLIEGLVGFLEEFKPALVFLPYLPREELARLIRERTGAWVVAFGSMLMLNSEYVDFVLQEPDPLACLELVEALEGKRQLDAVAGLSRRDGAAFARTLVPIHSVEKIFSEGVIDYSAFFRMGPGSPVEIRKHIAGDWGCAYRNSSFGPGSGLEGLLPEYAPRGGCTFCTRPCSNPLEWGRKRELLALQLDAVLAAFPAVKKLMVIDEMALSYVDELAKLLQSYPTRGIDILISGRLTHVKRYEDKLVTALGTLKGANSIRLYQFGIENLSDSVLRRFNKGLTFEQIGVACRQIFELASRHDNLEVEESFGFIMFDPWTTVDELRENAERFGQVNLPKMRSGAPFTAIRLFPEAPLYWRALEEGLLTGSMDESEFGYSVNSGWRFVHEEAGRVYEYLQKHKGRRDGWELLKAALKTVA